MDSEVLLLKNRGSMLNEHNWTFFMKWMKKQFEEQIYCSIKQKEFRVKNVKLTVDQKNISQKRAVLCSCSLGN